MDHALCIRCHSCAAVCGYMLAKNTQSCPKKED
ncbi:hypothetical protein [Acinetobacter johnsonii]